MQKEIRVVDDERGIIQVTTLDERWYGKQEQDKKTGLPVVTWKPSVTWIASYYPKGIGYMQWLAKHGWDEAEAIKVEAGDRGTVVHHAIEQLIRDGECSMDAMIKDREGIERQMTPDEWYCVVTFGQWYESVGRPKMVACEQTVESTAHGFAGTLDMILAMPEGNMLVDIKTGKGVYPAHRLQVAALAVACREEGIEIVNTAILQVGFVLNKIKHYKLTVTACDADFGSFIAIKDSVWAREVGEVKPLQRELPLYIKLTE